MRLFAMIKCQLVRTVRISVQLDLIIRCARMGEILWDSLGHLDSVSAIVRKVTVEKTAKS